MTSSQHHKFGFGCRFLGEDLSALELWDTILSFAKGAGLVRQCYAITPGLGSRRKCRDSQVLLSLEEIRREIALDDSNSFFISEDASLSPFATYFPTPQDGGIQRLNVAVNVPRKTPPEWDDLATSLSSHEQMVLAYSFDAKYHGWQNCSDPLAYQNMYGNIDGFSTRELPSIDDSSPIRTRLDISRNPGRETFDGLLPQRVASELWLGNSFWQLAPCKKEDILTLDFFLEVRDTPQFLYLKSWPHPFNRPDGEQGRIQQMLWRLLFHEDCEWPPGSGGISDEPVGGPPGLMPSDSTTL